MGGHFEQSGTWDGSNARAFCISMALFKSDELLELSRRQSAAKPQTLLGKVQRLGGFSSVRCNTPLASDTRKSDDIVLAPGDSGISRMLTTSPWTLLV